MQYNPPSVPVSFISYPPTGTHTVFQKQYIGNDGGAASYLAPHPFRGGCYLRRARAACTRPQQITRLILRQPLQTRCSWRASEHPTSLLLNQVFT
ncbi:hypothetical protein NDU88_007398 [Pleurodeles waltl]|uniref:Uncharacterized protein n=1 Tax=Pleurodeles waltl TaxID=8319 RepID=A0AAV7U1D8_PLEWA|nr:hypothetical protein NDU88_007398 [Pleurodeles waltl]